MDNAKTINNELMIIQQNEEIDKSDIYNNSSTQLDYVKALNAELLIDQLIKQQNRSEKANDLIKQLEQKNNEACAEISDLLQQLQKANADIQNHLIINEKMKILKEDLDAQLECANKTIEKLYIVVEQNTNQQKKERSNYNDLILQLNAARTTIDSNMIEIEQLSKLNIEHAGEIEKLKAELTITEMKQKKEEQKSKFISSQLECAVSTLITREEVQLKLQEAELLINNQSNEIHVLKMKDAESESHVNDHFKEISLFIQELQQNLNAAYSTINDNTTEIMKMKNQETEIQSQMNMLKLRNQKLKENLISQANRIKRLNRRYLRVWAQNKCVNGRLEQLLSIKSNREKLIDDLHIQMNQSSAQFKESQTQFEKYSAEFEELKEQYFEDLDNLLKENQNLLETNSERLDTISSLEIKIQERDVQIYDMKKLFNPKLPNIIYKKKS